MKGRKLIAARDARLAAAMPTGPSPKHTAIKPGSKNPKKGYGARRAAR